MSPSTGGDEIVWAVSESQLRTLLESARAGDSLEDIMLLVEDELGRVVDKSEDVTWKPNYRPANGTERDMFQAGPMGCFSCTVDHNEGWHAGDSDTGKSCPILMKSLIGEYPDEWEENFETRETRCTAWEGPCPCTEGTTYQPPPAEWLSHKSHHPYPKEEAR